MKKGRILEYCLSSLFIHVYLWATLTPWFAFGLHFTWEQYITWVWQAPLLALVINYPLFKLNIRINPWIRKVSGLE